MTAAELLIDLARRGIRLEADGNQLRFSPRSAVTPDLADRLRAHKTELLAILRPEADAPSVDHNQAAAVWQAAVDRLDGDTPLQAEILEGLRSASARWVGDEEPAERADDCFVEPLGPDGWPMGCINPDELTPCAKCRSLEQWQTMTGRWRCLHCDPPAVADRLAKRAAMLRQRSGLPPWGEDARVNPYAVCSCGSTRWRDVPVHNGQSVRRDCRECGRFLGFPVWNGTKAEHVTG